jgi:hypothetical protein
LGNIQIFISPVADSTEEFSDKYTSIVSFLVTNNKHSLLVVDPGLGVLVGVGLEDTVVVAVVVGVAVVVLVGVGVGVFD